MIKKINLNLIIFLLIIILTFAYNIHHTKNIQNERSLSYYIMICALEINDIKTVKLHAKKILNKNTQDIYRDISLVILHKISVKNYKYKKAVYLKRKIIKNKKTILNIQNYE